MRNSVGIVESEKRHCRQLADINREPNPPYPHERYRVKPMNREPIPIESRGDHPICVHNAHRQHPKRDVAKPPRMALVASGKQKEPWDEKLKGDQCGSRPFPTMTKAAHIPIDFFGN